MASAKFGHNGWGQWSIQTIHNLLQNCNGATLRIIGKKFATQPSVAGCDQENMLKFACIESTESKPAKQYTSSTVILAPTVSVLLCRTQVICEIYLFNHTQCSLRKCRHKIREKEFYAFLHFSQLFTHDSEIG